jgi:hypothetical protein
MSVPLVFMMLNQHNFWASMGSATPLVLAIVVLVGWALTYHLYQIATKVKGF